MKAAPRDEQRVAAEAGARVSHRHARGAARDHRARHRGPGDPFANCEETMETLRLARERFPELLLCLASNGLGIGPHIDELATMNVSHVTITLNAVDPKIGAKIYSWCAMGRPAARRGGRGDTARAPARRDPPPQGAGHHGEDQYDHHPWHQRRAHPRGRAHRCRDGRGHHELHGAHAREGRGVRGSARAGHAHDLARAAAGRAAPAADDALRALPRRRRGLINEEMGAEQIDLLSHYARMADEPSISRRSPMSRSPRSRARS